MESFICDLNNLGCRNPNYIKVAEDIDFFSIFRKVEKEYKYCFLFESLGEDRLVSRHHVLGFDPKYVVASDDVHSLRVLDTHENHEVSYRCENAYYEMRKFIPKGVFSFRYAGGLVGYLGYDVINYFEPSLRVKGNEMFEPFKFGLYLDGLIYDQVTGEVLYFYYDENRYDEIAAYFKGDDGVYGDLEVSFVGDSMSKDKHRETVLRVKEDVLSGRVFQCEVGFRSSYKVKGDTVQLYGDLRGVNPSPHMFYLKFENAKLIGASPELLFRLRGNEMETFPLAGTTRRGGGGEEDTSLARALLNDPKEVAEHNMLVDLHRNDIGKVARIGTVSIRKLMEVKRFSHVQHISSEISGIISENEDMFSALASSFPAGTLTGAPKIEAIKIVNEIEEEGRGPYGGAVGKFSFNGDCDFAIPIRSIFVKGEMAYVRTCGGIVFDSDPENEYEEIQRKLSAMKSVLDKYILEKECVL